MTTVGDIGISPVLLQAITHLSGSQAARVKQEQVDKTANGNGAAGSAYIPPVKTIKVGNTEFVVREAQTPSAQVTPKDRTVLVIRKVKDENSALAVSGQNLVGQGIAELPQNWVSLAKSMYAAQQQSTNNSPTVLRVGGGVISQLPLTNRIPIVRNGGSDGMVAVAHDEGVQEIEVETQPFDSFSSRLYSSGKQQLHQPLSEDGGNFSPSFDESSTDVSGMMHLNASQDDEWPSSDSKRFRFDDLSSMYANNAVLRTSGAAPRVQIMSGSNGNLYRPMSLASGSLNDPNNAAVFGEPCPVCGDKISGYHYGAFTCESCKGFFKRTVQNKKAFDCNHAADCDINLMTRKKCPACRFQKCLNTGMRVEAIRQDRTRGGRSYYAGSINPKSASMSGGMTGVRSMAPITPVVTSHRTMVVPSGGTGVSPAGGAAGSQVYVLAHNTASGHLQSGMTVVQPAVPKILEEIMALDSLMYEEEVEMPACCEGKMCEGDTEPFASLLHFADHCLYRIVRWARNLPDFSTVATDNQILLLQNCWAELLCLSAAWKSVSTEGSLALPHGRVLDLDTAVEIGLGDLMQRLLNLTQMLRVIRVDKREIALLKALLLLSPDVRHIANEASIRQCQDRILDALLTYSSSHYPQQPNKTCEMLACLPALSRMCMLGKEQLGQRQIAGEMSQCSLFSELLKGDVAVQ